MLYNSTCAIMALKPSETFQLIINCLGHRLCTCVKTVEYFSVDKVRFYTLLNCLSLRITHTCAQVEWKTVVASCLGPGTRKHSMFELSHISSLSNSRCPIQFPIDIEFLTINCNLKRMHPYCLYILHVSSRLHTSLRLLRDVILLGEFYKVAC